MNKAIVGLMRVARPDNRGKARIGRRQVYIFPTRYGFMYGLAVFVMLVGALNYGSNLGLLFAFLFAAIGIVAILHTWRNLVDIEATVGRAAPVFAGENAGFSIQLLDTSGRERPRIGVSSIDGFPSVTDILALAGTDLVLRVPAVNRGYLRLGRIKVFTFYPLGLLRAWCYVDSDAQVLIYPRPGNRSSHWRNTAYIRSEKGDRGVGADDFVGPRRYRPGDPPSHLDWKALARERGLVTRQFGGDRQEQVWLDWETLGTLADEERLSLLCRAVLDAAGEDLRYGLRVPGASIPPGAGDAHKHQCLSALARYRIGTP